MGLLQLDIAKISMYQVLNAGCGDFLPFAIDLL